MAVHATGWQNHDGRFMPVRKDAGDYEASPPSVSRWRCNLVRTVHLMLPVMPKVYADDLRSSTGLSHVENLYFVAYGEDVYVYIPQFPTQALSLHPALTFTSQPSTPGLRGAIDPRNPHTINSLLVHHLGTEEVVAVVRDDGDVDAFLVRHIVQAISRKAEPENTIESAADDVRPFFQSNVGISAWGLAVHAEARIIAVSSNAHEVRIFKFGLLQQDESEEGPRPVVQSKTAHSAAKDNTARKTDVTHHVLNGHTNIPYIAFCNTGDDPEARWLLTTDISGVCRVMDLHALQPVQAFRFGRSFASSHYGGHDRLNAGWAVMFLDRRSFKPEDTVEAALGLKHGESLPGIHRSEAVWDLSRTIDRLAEASEPFVYHNLPEQRNAATDDGTGRNSISDEWLSSDVEDTTSEPDSESDGGIPVEIEVEVDDSIEDDHSQQLEVELLQHADGEERASSAEQDEDWSNSDQEHENTRQLAPGTSDGDSGRWDNQYLIDDGEDPEDEGTEDSVSFTSFYDGKSICGNEPRFTTAGSLCDGLPCPILHASVRNIYLLQPRKSEKSEERQDHPFVPPLLGFANPLRQSIHQEHAYLRLFERFNMNAYIPSLGIVVLASQKGRAIVLGLTKLSSSTKYSPEMKGNAGKTNYCMRVVAILPFAEQEKAKQRPPQPLHGIAVGPMQGSEAVEPEKRRWRLIMTWQDHSTLSYELTSSRSAEESGIDVEALVV